MCVNMGPGDRIIPTLINIVLLGNNPGQIADLPLTQPTGQIGDGF
jgi:hypothetical protein